MSNIRLRFAPSPTGPLHIGGVRTALYNYFLAKKTEGTFILRIEDTDQNRYVEGAEEYIKETLKWFGIEPEEGPGYGGDYGPYRQSERKHLYKKYAEELVEKGHAYYAFDTVEDLEKMRADAKARGEHSAMYNHATRMSMKNSLTLSESETRELLEKSENVTIRLKIPADETIHFQDVVRGDVRFESNLLDDKIMLKTDGMPTYHLANIVDDHLMQISHVIRGEEWLPSTAHHVLMYRFFGWDAPIFAHLPLLLKPNGKGKLSKRDGAKFGFPVFPLDWQGENEADFFGGFREGGFLPEALLNFLAFLGWNPGTEQEIFDKEALTQAFSMEKIVKSGAKFDFEKAKWYNQQYIIAADNERLANLISDHVKNAGYGVTADYLTTFCELMKERVHTINDFLTDGRFFFEAPEVYEEKMIRKRFKTENIPAFDAMAESLKYLNDFTATHIEAVIKGYVQEKALKFGEILPIIRIAMTGSMKGPDLFKTMELLGKEESLKRWGNGMNAFPEIVSKTM